MPDAERGRRAPVGGRLPDAARRPSPAGGRGPLPPPVTRWCRRTGDVTSTRTGGAVRDGGRPGGGLRGGGLQGGAGPGVGGAGGGLPGARGRGGRFGGEGPGRAPGPGDRGEGRGVPGRGRGVRARAGRSVPGRLRTEAPSGSPRPRRVCRGRRKAVDGSAAPSRRCCGAPAQLPYKSADLTLPSGAERLRTALARPSRASRDWSRPIDGPRRPFYDPVRHSPPCPHLTQSRASRPHASVMSMALGGKGAQHVPSEVPYSTSVG